MVELLLIRNLSKVERSYQVPYTLSRSYETTWTTNC